MVIVNFSEENMYPDYYPEIWQYDYGQILRIQGLTLPPAVEVHFSLQNTGGETTTRIGVTKDGVTDVVIPDSFLENGYTTQDYEIYAFVYLRNETSGQTEYKITMHVTSRPKPEAFDRPEDAEIFKEAIKAVNESAARSAESEKQAEGWAHGREDLPERTQDNAKYYSDQAREDSMKTDADRKEVGRLVESVSGIGEQVEKVEGLTKQAQTSATNAALSEQAAKESENNAAQARAGAEAAEDNAELASQKVEQDKAIVEQAKNIVKQMGQEVLDNKNLVDETAQNFDLKAQQALADVNNAGQAQAERVQTAGNDAVESVKAAQGTATRAVETAKTEAIKVVRTEGTTQVGNVSAEGEKQVQAVRGAAQEIMADREQIQENKTGIAKLKEDIGNKAPAIIKKASGKTIIINDSSNLPIKTLSGTGEIIVTGKNILKTEKYNEFIPFEAKAGTLFTLITNGELSKGGNIRFTGENDEEIWFGIDKGKTRVSAKISRNVKGYTNLLSPKEGLKYCLSTGENDEYKEYVEQVITAPVDSEQLKTIHTNYPTTVLTSENEISVEYVADTEAYIGKRIKEENQSLQKQILEIQNALISQKISGGGIIQVKDSAKFPIQNLRVFGKSEQNGVPSLDAPVPIVNVGEKGNIKINITGKNLIQGRMYYVNYSNGILFVPNINEEVRLPYVPERETQGIGYVIPCRASKTYTISVKNPNENAIVAIAEYADINMAAKYANALGYLQPRRNNASYTAKSDGIIVCGIAGLWTNGCTTIHECTESELLQVEEGAMATEYEVPAEHQSLALFTPNGLPGLKVDANGNYKDENGQQWICDEINSAERIRRIGRIDSYNHESIDTEYMSSTGELSVGANVIYALKEPIKTPLSEEEKLSIKKLHANHPETLISNDENADMELTYTVNTKSYVDGKIAALSKAIL